MAGRAESTATKEELEQGIIDGSVSPGSYSGLIIASAPVDGVDEVHTLTISGSPGGGTFTVTYNGVTSGNIAYNASAAVVKAALEAMSSIGTGNVDVSGSAGGPYTVTLKEFLGGKPIGALTVAHAFTGGSTPDIADAITTPGVTGSFRGEAAKAAICHRTDTPNIYVNKGSLYKPSWKQVTTA